MTTPTSPYARAQALIARPGEEWARIAAEAPDRAGPPLVYALVMAAINPLAHLVHDLATGAPIVPGVLAIRYGLALAVLAVLALLARVLVPLFGGLASWPRALALVSYGATAAWLSGIFALAPALGFFAVLGLYSFWLLHLGLGTIGGVPRDRGVLPGLLIGFAALALILSIRPLTARMADALSLLPPPSAAPSAIPPRPPRTAVDVAQLQELFPNRIGDFVKDETASQSPLANAAQATYRRDADTMSVRIRDLVALPAPAESADSRIEDAAPLTASLTYQRRFLIEAEGTGVTARDLQAAVTAIDPDDLADLAE